ncbi:pyridoxal phosphate-dependent transferase [Zalerion maritima]|uniref:Pyridoxal phosphate-dependent transferase n=1 Tax=Zalerion maritima TaxID=339359 RepID=A0AAD5RH63_9PEZI|nr:pyridoxal phosphate-dependent transferase [Zalerion maritima]
MDGFTTQGSRGVWGDHEVFSEAYNKATESLRQQEYPHMSKGCYLDHGGATIYAKSTVEQFSHQMLNNLYGNPHSMNTPAEDSGHMVDRIREKTLRFLGADPEHYDLIFTANATAAIKLVADGFRDLSEKTNTKKFWYGYHKDCHTSLVGVREFTGGMHHCFENDESVEEWLAGHYYANRPDSSSMLGLFAYPGQSNMTGRRLPVSWVEGIRKAPRLQHNTYTLFDAAALAMTSDLSSVFADPSVAPDFTCMSFYKMFGFPDLGGLVVRRDSGHILTLRKYFGGGTVTMVSVIGGSWHHSKGIQQGTNDHFNLHDGLEDGTLPFHSILALGEAIDVQKRLYGSMKMVSRHTSHLVRRLRDGFGAIRHGNGRPVVEVYGNTPDAYGDARRQGGTIAFNLVKPDGTYIPYSRVEELANNEGFYIRSGGVCCPGGLFTALGYEPWELLRAMSAGHGCGYQSVDVIGPKPTGIVRASLGGMTTVREVDSFVHFIAESFVQTKPATLTIPRRPVDSRPSVAAGVPEVAPRNAPMYSPMAVPTAPPTPPTPPAPKLVAVERWSGNAVIPEPNQTFGSILTASQSTKNLTPTPSVSSQSYFDRSYDMGKTDLAPPPSIRERIDLPSPSGSESEGRKRNKMFKAFNFKKHQAGVAA